MEWVKLEHPFTALTGALSVHANHNLAQNSAFKRRASADLRRHLAAQRLEGLQRLLDVQPLVHPLGTTALETGKKQDFGNGNRIVCPSRFNQSNLD